MALYKRNISVVIIISVVLAVIIIIIICTWYCPSGPSPSL
jgi:hypothetical protein